MFPLITIFGKDIGMYPLIAIAAGMLVGVLLCRRISRLGLDDNDAIVFMLIVAAGIIVGGSFLYALTNLKYVYPLFLSKSPDEVLYYINLLFGGSVFYGGLIGGAFAGWLYVTFKHLDKTVYMDAMAPLIPLFHGFARIGCFLGGCCYGIESNIGFVVHDNPLLPELNGIRRFPVQLLESAGEFIIFIILQILYSKIWSTKAKEAHSAASHVRSLQGRLLPLYLILYTVLRFFDEFLRGDTIRGFVFDGLLSTSQFISILLFAVGMVWLIVSHQKKTNTFLS